MPKIEYDNKQYQKTLRDKRRAEGWKEVTTWFDAETLTILDDLMSLMQVSGSKGKTTVLSKAIRVLSQQSRIGDCNQK
jgi:UDP-N-acetylmuramoylalanine-D-glutamate ligase